MTKQKKQKDYNYCRCGNVKYSHAKRCWECYANKKRGQLSRQRYRLPMPLYLK